MKIYQDLLQDVLENGERQDDRTGIGTISLFGDLQYKIDLRDGFPLLTTKKISWKNVVGELLWFLDGDTNNNTLLKQGIKIWEPWVADSHGNLGKIYGYQWRHWGARYEDPDCLHHIETDQISNLIRDIKNTPFSRRLLVTAWNPEDIEKKEVSLPSCHTLWQIKISSQGWMDLKLYQRSCDLMIGLPYNLASYSLLLSMIAQVTGYRPRYFYHTFGDAHIYLNHLDQVNEQLSRQPRNLPQLILNKNIENIFDFKFEDCKIEGYDPYPAIKAPVAV